MSRGITAVQVWTQIPVASRTVEVNTKTGFSLTAGSYSVRASSTQGGVVTDTAAASGTATISSVTTTRARVGYNGAQLTGTPSTADVFSNRLELTNATTVTTNRTTGTGTATTSFQVVELF